MKNSELRLTDATRSERLEWPERPVDLVLDTDTYNEIDDQMALVYAILSPDRMNLRAITAAPFHNDRSESPEDGMEKSYGEILRLLALLDVSHEGLVFRGAAQWMPDAETPVANDAVSRIIALARERDDDDPLYVAAIGAVTNIASALVAAPDITDRIVVAWLGGHPSHWHHAHEFNLCGDLVASRVLFDCGVPLVWFPCAKVAEQLNTTLPEMKAYADGRGRVGSYLYEIFADYHPEIIGKPGGSKVIWDLAPIGWLNHRDGFTSRLTSSPILTSDVTWSRDPARHLVREVTHIQRDVVFADLFAKLSLTA